jgi:hypothetical protein
MSKAWIRVKPGKIKSLLIQAQKKEEFNVFGVYNNFKKREVVEQVCTCNNC